MLEALEGAFRGARPASEALNFTSFSRYFSKYRFRLFTKSPSRVMSRPFHGKLANLQVDDAPGFGGLVRA